MIAPRSADRNGGYTRVLRTRIRPGDRTQMALIEFVEAGPVEKTEKKKRRVVRSKAAQTAEQADSSK